MAINDRNLTFANQTADWEESFHRANYAPLISTPVIVAEILAELLFTGFTKEESYGTTAAYSRFAARRMGMSASASFHVSRNSW